MKKVGFYPESSITQLSIYSIFQGDIFKITPKKIVFSDFCHLLNFTPVENFSPALLGLLFRVLEEIANSM